MVEIYRVILEIFIIQSNAAFKHSCLDILYRHCLLKISFRVIVLCSS